MTFTQTDARTVIIQGAARRIRFQVTRGDAALHLGRDADKYWSPYPALRAFPIELIVPPPGEQLRQTVAFELQVMDPDP
jgi:hypothetical protein